MWKVRLSSQKKNSNSKFFSLTITISYSFLLSIFSSPTGPFLLSGNFGTQTNQPGFLCASTNGLTGATHGNTMGSVSYLKSSSTFLTSFCTTNNLCSLRFSLVTHLVQLVVMLLSHLYQQVELSSTLTLKNLNTRRLFSFQNLTISSKLYLSLYTIVNFTV